MLAPKNSGHGVEHSFSTHSGLAGQPGRWALVGRGMTMGMGKRLSIVAVASLARAACVGTEEIPLAPNMVRLDTRASGALSAGQAPKVKCAKRRRSSDAPDRLSPIYGLKSAQVCGQGSELRDQDRFWRLSDQPLVMPTALPPMGDGFCGQDLPAYGTVGVTVIMFHSNGRERKEQFNAVDVLAQYGSRWTPLLRR